MVYAWKVVQNRTLPHLNTWKLASDLAPFEAQIIHQHTPRLKAVALAPRFGSRGWPVRFLRESLQTSRAESPVQARMRVVIVEPANQRAETNRRTSLGAATASGHLQCGGVLTSLMEHHSPLREATRSAPAQEEQPSSASIDFRLARWSELRFYHPGDRASLDACVLRA